MKILLAFVLLFLPFSAFAQSILINEIAWMGTPVAGVEEKQWWRYEWLELYNANESPLQLDGWKIEFLHDKLDFTVSLQGTIVANGYYVAGASDKIPNLDFSYKNLGGKFFNGGQRVILKNNLGEIIDELDARSGWQAGDNKTKQTMERISLGRPGLTVQWQTSAEPGGTPKTPNSAGVSSSTLAKLRYPNLSLAKDAAKDTQEETEKDLARSSSSSSPLASPQPQSFQSRVPLVNPITLLAGLLALGFSGALLVLKRSLALRQRSGQASRQERQRS